jgi:hypothetical protein
VAWSWSSAWYGLVCGLPAAAVTLDDVPHGLAFAIGALPTAVIGVAPRRRDRPRVMAVGALAGVSLLSGALLAEVAWCAVVGIFVLAVGAAELARRLPAGDLVLLLAVPLVAIGFSVGDAGEAAVLAVIMTGGGVVAGLVSLAWPERDALARVARTPVDADYGVRLGLAGATAAALGFALDLDHVGWACGAALLVMRPSLEMTKRRSVGRLGAVAIGAATAVVVAEATDRPIVYAVLVLAALAAATGTRASRWYLTAGFTTFLALSLLVYGDPRQGPSRFGERVVETALGVGLALLFGIVVPAWRDRGRWRPTREPQSVANR